MLKILVRSILTRYCPVLLPVAYACVHAFKLGPYLVQQRSGNGFTSAVYLKRLQEAVAKKNRQIHPPNSFVHLVLHTHGLSSGGAERQWCYLAKNLAHRGYAVTLLVESLDGPAEHYLPLLEGSTVRVLSMDRLSIPKKIIKKYKYSLPYSVYSLVLAFALLRPSHVLAELDGGNIWGGAAVAFSDCNIERFLMSFRNVNPSHFPHFYEKWMDSLYKAVLPLNSLVLSGNSQFGNNDYARWLGIDPRSVVCTRNAIDMPTEDLYVRPRMRQSFGVEGDAPVVLGIFRLAPEKNPELFLAVAREIIQKIPRAVILHAGEGPLLPYLQRKAMRLGLEGKLYFLGRRRDVADLMRAADILLLTSDFEGLPNVLLEAQAMRLPVIATRVGGVPEAVREGETAFLAPRGDKATLVRYCLALLQSPSLRDDMGRKGKEFLDQNFGQQALGDRVLRAVGLPLFPERPSHLIPRKFVQGDTSAAAYGRQLVTDFLATTTRPVIVFATNASVFHDYLPLPKGSVCVCAKAPTAPHLGVICFDWQSNPDWSGIKRHIPPMAIALFLDGNCCDLALREKVCGVGIPSILYPKAAALYLMPAVMPPLLCRVWSAILSVLRCNHPV